MENNDKLNELVNNIFKIIPSYYDESEAEQIKQLINEYVDQERII